MVERELLKLIEKMADRGSYTSSEDSPSWNAYRKAREITDISVIPFLNNLLEKVRIEKSGMVFILYLVKLVKIPAMNG